MRKKRRQPLFVLWKERFIRHCRTGVIFQEKLAKTHRVSDLFDVLPFSIYCLCYQPHKPFYIVTAVCTVDLLILKTFAAARTVAPVSSMYSPKTSALSCIASFIQSTPLKASYTLSHWLIVYFFFAFYAFLRQNGTYWLLLFDFEKHSLHIPILGLSAL